MVALSGAVPQRGFRNRGLRRQQLRQARQETGYLAPAVDSYVTPAAADALYSAPEEPVAAAAEVDNSYLAPVAAAAELDNSYAAPAESDSSYLAPEEEYEEYEEEYEAEAAASDTGYLAPAADEAIATYDEVPSYGVEEELGGYNDDLDSAASDDAGESDPLKMLMNAVPGVPGEDYPIYSEAPETAFSCDGQVDGGEWMIHIAISFHDDYFSGYYADEEAQCQVFHICTADGAGGLAKYSFLCPNGTLFNQNYFICDWWFNFDCAEAEGLYSLNDQYAAERDALAGAASDAQADYAAPAAEAADAGYAAPAEYSGAEGARLRTGRQRPSGRGGRRQGF